jgi:hypothetical protein
VVTERWKPIQGYEGLYEVSCLGRVRSLRRIKPNGQFVPDRILAQTPTRSGYARVSIQKNGIKWHARVHRLVAMAYIPNPMARVEVNHIDGNKLNNSSANLEWSCRSEQMLHAYRVLKVPHGRRKKMAA